MPGVGDDDSDAELYLERWNVQGLPRRYARQTRRCTNPTRNCDRRRGIHWIALGGRAAAQGAQVFCLDSRMTGVDQSITAFLDNAAFHFIKRDTVGGRARMAAGVAQRRGARSCAAPREDSRANEETGVKQGDRAP